LRRAIEHNLEDAMSEDLLRGNFVGKDTITVTVGEVNGEKKLIFESTSAVAAPELVAGLVENKG
jgi:ATP-dependent Clp protease ATP-binding subunit ClpC